MVAARKISLLFTLLFLSACQPFRAAARPAATPTPYQPWPATPTPFLPIHPTPSAAGPPLELTYQFLGVDFSPGAPEITLRFWPDSDSLNAGLPIKVRFRPGQTCDFGDHQACIQHFSTPDHQREVIWVSVHSGVGGEGQALRHALEGTGVNSAGWPLEQVAENLDEINRARVSLKQGEKDVADAGVISALRIPAGQLEAYFELPLEEALALLLEMDPDISNQFKPATPLIVLETCGWRMPGEAGGELVAETSASIYLILLE